jgi:multidrug efflux pump subunit AcrA (membrane-fusion protein)
MMSAKRKKKVVIFSIIFAVAVIAAFVAMKAAGGKKDGPQSSVKSGKAEVADVQVKVTEVGNVQPEVKVDVKSAVSGKVTTIFHRDGDTVHRGDVLARVEPDLNQAQSLAETKNALSSAQIRYEQTKKNYWRTNRIATARATISRPSSSSRKRRSSTTSSRRAASRSDSRPRSSRDRTSWRRWTAWY